MWTLKSSRLKSLNGALLIMGLEYGCNLNSHWQVIKCSPAEHASDPTNPSSQHRAMANASVFDKRDDHVTAACRTFFKSWLRRSENRRDRWKLESPPTYSLDYKIQHLRNEITCLAAQDAQLFYQLFALQECIDDLKEKFDEEVADSASTSPSSLSPASSSTDVSHTIDSLRQPTSLPVSSASCTFQRSPVVAHTGFIRQRVSYPPSGRNRSSRSQLLSSAEPSHTRLLRPRSVTATSTHEASSLDSGIHIPDHEIFV